MGAAGSSPLTCPKCHAVIADHLRFCTSCGISTDIARLAAEAERLSHDVGESPLKARELAAIQERVAVGSKPKRGGGKGCFIFLLGFALFMALMGASAGAAIFPASFRFAAPMVCPSDYDHSVVVVTTYSYKPGQRGTTGSLYCIDSEGRPMRASTGYSVLALWGLYSVLLVLLFALLFFIRRLARGKEKNVAAAGMVLLLASLSGCSWGTMSSDEFQEKYGSARTSWDSLLSGTKGLHRMSKAIQERLGRRPVLYELTIHEGHASFVARDPRKPENFDTYDYRDGELTRSRPYSLNRRRAQGRIFRLDEVPLRRISAMVKTTATRLRLKKATNRHVNVGRDARAGKVTVRVFCSSARRSGSVVFDAQGHQLKVYGD